MNGCMQDAFNLGWKLAAVCNDKADAKILDSYERERKPIGEQISEGAMATHEIVMGFGMEPEERLQFTQEPGWEARTIRLVSGLSHNYTASVVVPDGLHAVAGPQAGERAPDALLTREPQKRVYDVFRHPGFTLLIVPGTDAEAQLETARKLRAKIDAQYPDQVSCCLISDRTDAGFDFDHRVLDGTGEIRERYAIGEEGRLLLVRPDLYVGLPVLPEDASAIAAYLEQWFCKSPIGSG